MRFEVRPGLVLDLIDGSYSRAAELTRADAMLFLVDASDHNMMSHAKRELDALLHEPRVAERGTPIALLGNKIDQPGALSEGELRRALSLERTAG